MRRLVLIALGFFVGGCSPASSARPVAIDREMNGVTISASAAGWGVRAGPSKPGRHPATILVDPRGIEHDVGETMYPDVVRAVLWRVRAEELRLDLLVLYVPPAASGATAMSVFRILPGDRPVRLADIRHHYEFGFIPGQRDPARVKVAFPDSPGGRLLREFLFVDSDGDGILELKEGDSYR
jgi:hypothetical protein